MKFHQFISDHASAIGFSASGGAAVTGATVAAINPYLQAAAFLVSLAVGICTLADYWRKYKARKAYHDKQPKD